MSTLQEAIDTVRMLNALEAENAQLLDENIKLCLELGRLKTKPIRDREEREQGRPIEWP